MACGKAAESYYPEIPYGDYQGFCANKDYKSTVESCIAENSHYNSSQMGEAWERFSLLYCEVHGLQDEVGDLLTAAETVPPHVVSAARFARAYDAEFHLLAQKDQSVWLALGLCFYWLGICLIAAVFKFFHHAFSALVGPHLLLQRRHPAWYRWLQRKVFWPAFYGQRHMVRYRFGWVAFSLATRFESLVILVFFLLSLIFMLTPYTFMDADPYFESRWKEMMRYGSDRSGIIGTFLMPLFLLFGMRNNLLMWATGWSYQRFNVFHRAIARVSYALLIVHSVMKHIFAASYHASLVKYFYPTMLYRYGVAAMFLFAIMIFTASFRSKFYRAFHYIHVMFAFAGLMCSIYHLNDIGYKEPLYLCFALWCADWALRLGRVLIFNFSTIFAPIPGSHRATYATAHVFNEEVAHLKIRLPVKWPFYPGQYVYLHFNRYCLLNGHPFSVVGPSSSGHGAELCIKARTGMTRRLLRTLIERGCDEKSAVTVPVFLEGPYGSSAPVATYDEGLLIAGGIGITGVLGYADRMRAVHGDSRVHVIHLVWIVRSRQEFAFAASHLTELQSKGGVDISLFCRSEKSRSFSNHTDPVSLSPGENVVVDYDPARARSSSRESGSRHSSKTSSDLKHPRSSQHYSRDSLSDCNDNECPGCSACANNRETPYFDAVLEQRMNVLAEAGLDLKMEDDGYQPSTDPFTDSAAELVTERFDAIDDMIQSSTPDIESIVRTFLQKSKGSVCVAACGPPGMMDAINAAVCKNMEYVEYGQVHYFEEAFMW